MKISDLGEGALIELIRDWTGGASRKVILGPGDDAALLESTPDHHIVVSTDAFREGVHFSREHFSPDQIGHKVMAATLSDLAAMGASANAAFLNLHAPPDTDVEFLRGVFQGMDRIADACGAVIAGGDTVAGDLAFGITVVGSVPEGAAIRREGAREGDVLCVSGELGKSEAGRMILAGEASGAIPRVMKGEAETAHLMPRPRFDVSRLLMTLERRTVDVELSREEFSKVRPTSMIDVSDGLGIDLARICEASHVGCRIEERSVPVNGAARLIALEGDERPIDLALRGGEDFELLFTISPADVEIMLEASRKAAISITPIGQIVPRRDGLVLAPERGVDEPWPATGFDHFRKLSS